jgi:hypothetical protein
MTRFAECLESVPVDQVIAMIDKYYKDNPQRWSKPLGDEIVTSLIVPDGPCAGNDPWR